MLMHGLSLLCDILNKNRRKIKCKALLRDCKEDVVVIEPVFRYNTDAIGGLHMRLCEKIVELRKSNNNENV